MKREGYFENGMTRPGGALNQLFRCRPTCSTGARRTASPIRSRSTTTATARPITGGFAYHGRIAALRGKFVFGDIVRGRLFAADLAAMKKADDGIPPTVAPVEEIQLVTCAAASGKRVHVVAPRAGRARRRARRWRAPTCTSAGARDGELFVTSRQDGMIRMLVP